MKIIRIMDLERGSKNVELATLNQLGENKKELDFFNIIFDNIFWENVVTETNR